MRHLFHAQLLLWQNGFAYCWHELKPLHTMSWRSGPCGIVFGLYIGTGSRA